MIWYAFAMKMPGIYWEGPQKGQPYPAGDLVTTTRNGEGTFVIVTQDIEEARFWCPRSAEIITLPELPEHHIIVQEWVAPSWRR